MEIEINFPKIRWPKFLKKTKPVIREEVRRLKRSLEEFPDEWEGSGVHTITHKELDINLWVSNGWEYLDFWPKIEAFTKSEQKYLWDAAKNIQNRCKTVAKEQDWAEAIRKLKQWGNQ